MLIWLRACVMGKTDSRSINVFEGWKRGEVASAEL